MLPKIYVSQVLRRLSGIVAVATGIMVAVLRYIGSVTVRGTIVSDMKKKVALSVYKRLKVDSLQKKECCMAMRRIWSSAYSQVKKCLAGEKGSSHLHTAAGRNLPDQGSTLQHQSCFRCSRTIFCEPHACCKQTTKFTCVKVSTLA